MGVIGTFIGVSIWLFVAAALRRAQQVAQVRTFTRLVQPSGVIAIVSILLLGIARFYMALTAWGEQATWIIVATISFVLLAPFGACVIDPRLRALARAAAAPDGPLPAAMAARTHDPLVRIGLYLYVGVLVGIVFLMTTKPPLAISIFAMVVAAMLGLAVGLPLWWTTRSSAREKRDIGNFAT